MRVGKLCGDVKLEVIMVRNDRVSKFDDSAARLLEGLGVEKKAKISWTYTQTIKKNNNNKK